MIKARIAAPALGRRWRVGSVAAIAALLSGGLLLPRFVAGTPGPAAAPPAPLPVVTVPAAPLPSIAATPASVPKDLLRLAGPVPLRGEGTFVYAPGRGRVFGTAGPLRRFRVAVENGSNEDVAAFAAQVEATLGDPRSWIGGGRLRMQRVAGADRSDFTIYLATRDTAGTMCARGGVNIRVGGRPYTSCRSTGKTIINLDRWRLSAPTYVAAKVPLATYRQYVINHEVGHELGHHHQGCPHPGGPAPVMLQQTLGLDGCRPSPWPFP
jgi:hypothetical protein